MQDLSKLTQLKAEMQSGNQVLGLSPGCILWPSAAVRRWALWVPREGSG